MTSLDRIAAIAAAAEAADGAEPIDEATWLALRHPDRHDVRQWGDEQGFAAVTGRTLSLVVHPDARGRGSGPPCSTRRWPTPTYPTWRRGRMPTTPPRAGWRRRTASSGCGSCG